MGQLASISIEKQSVFYPASTRKNPQKLDSQEAIFPLLTVKQVAERLSVSTATVYALCEKGSLRSIKVLNAIRVSEDDLGIFLVSG